MLAYCPLASGSKGNCLLLCSPKTRILIDCGISAKELQKRLQAFDLNISDIEAIFITHEHSDHISGLKGILKQVNIPIICNMETAHGICHSLREIIPCQIFTTGESFEWKDLCCFPFSVAHDALDPVGFKISWQDQHLGICTDLGFISATLYNYLADCQFLYIEANHEPALVQESSRPLLYKQRVLSQTGHLSNEASGQFIKRLWHKKLQHVYLAHLSDECNRPEIALRIVHRLVNGSLYATPIAVAHQHKPGSMISMAGCRLPREPLQLDREALQLDTVAH